MKKGTLYIFSGLPASGKTTLAKELARRTHATFLRIDTVEQGLRDVCKMNNIEGEGYRLSYLLSKDNLVLGNDVIADSVNPWKLTRDEWNNVATSVNANYINIEVKCSDKKEHRCRLENRNAGIENLEELKWEEVINRDYHEWDIPREVIETAGKTIEVCANELFYKLQLVRK